MSRSDLPYAASPAFFTKCLAVKSTQKHLQNPGTAMNALALCGTLQRFPVPCGGCWDSASPLDPRPEVGGPGKTNEIIGIAKKVRCLGKKKKKTWRFLLFALHMNMLLFGY